MRSRAILTAPEGVTQLYWYSDSAPVAQGKQSPGASTNDSAWKFLKEMADWCTLQKEIVTYRLPISSTNMTLELLDYIKFSDPIYTANTLRPGWITYLEVDTKNDQILIEATLNPADLAFDRALIERGIFMNIDTVTEGVNQADSIEEPQEITYVP
jgi:hypothetical protein